jgi:hypothetical protein
MVEIKLFAIINLEFELGKLLGIGTLLDLSLVS